MAPYIILKTVTLTLTQSQTLNLTLTLTLTLTLIWCLKFDTFFRHPFDARNIYISISKLSRDRGKMEEIAIMVSVWDWSARYCTYHRERPSLLDLLAVRFRINFWLDGWGSISPLEIGPMHLSVEGLRPWDWSYPVLQYLREWPTPTVVSSLSRVLSLNTNQLGTGVGLQKAYNAKKAKNRLVLCFAANSLVYFTWLLIFFRYFLY